MSRTEAPPGNPSLAALSAGSRVAGAVVALGYLTGGVAGALPGAIAGLGLMTFGRGLVVRRSEILPLALALAVIAAGLFAGALRWASLDLAFVRGAQAVLGPTVAVGPAAAAAGSALAAAACVVALAAWLQPTRADSLRGVLPWAAEGVPVALAAVTVFWGPKVVAGLGDVAGWGALTLAVTGLAAALAVVLGRVPARFRGLPLLLAGAAALAGGGLIARGI